MIEFETGYNTHEEPRPGECYCNLLRGQRMCRACIAELCYCDDDRYCDPCLDDMRADPAEIAETEAMIARFNETLFLPRITAQIQLPTLPIEERKTA